MSVTRLYELATQAQITPAWSNFDGTATVYLTQNPSLNQITLTLTNNTGAAVVMPLGTPAEWNALPGNQSAIYLWFNGLLSNEELQGITLAGAQWKLQYFADSYSDYVGYLVVAPVDDVPVPAGGSLTFEFGNVLASAAISGQVDIDLVGASGLDASLADTQVFVSVQSQPVASNQPLDLVVGFAGTDIVFTGGGSNDLTLFLTNPNPTPLVPGGDASWGSTAPVFQLSLVFGNTAGALTTLADAVAIWVDIENAYGNAWKPVVKQIQGDVPTWLLSPDQNGGGQVLGTGANATVAFSINGISTQLAQGLTFAYLSYTNVPGYNDGFFALEIVKVDGINITEFSAYPLVVTNATAPTTVNLELQVQNATYVAITNTPYATQTSESWTDATEVVIYATTSFTLLANNFATGQQVAQTVTVTISPNPYELMPAGSIVMWSGNQDSIPNGWALCNGQTVNNYATPNLTDRFIQAADPALEGQAGGVGTSGPADTHTHVIDAASLSGSTGLAGAHSHVTTIATVSTTLGGSDSVWALQGNGGAGTQNSFPSSTVSAHVHSINLTIPQATSETQDGASPMRPAWFALYFIMKCY